MTCTPGRSENCWTDGPRIVRIELAGDGEDRVVDALGVEPAAVLPPEPLVVAVDRGERGVMPHALPVDRAGDDQAMQRLERAPRLEKPARQPVEQLGMRRQAAHPAEIAGCRHQPPAEMPVPDAVDDRPPGERVRWDR